MRDGWTYDLVRWGRAGDIALNLASLTPDGVLDRIAGDYGRAWPGKDIHKLTADR